MNKYELFFYRLYILIGILGVIAFLVFAANGCEEQRRIKRYMESEHSKLLPLSDTSK
jgi:hypothetical protein